MKKSTCNSFVVMLVCFSVRIRARIVINQVEMNSLFTVPAKDMDEQKLLAEYGRFMLSNMDQTVDPCENFFEYACGNWANNTMIPILGRNQTSISALQFASNDLIIGFLRNKTKTDDINTAETKAKQYFSSCLKMSGNISVGYRTLWSSLNDPNPKEGEILDWISLNFNWHYSVPPPLLPISAIYNASSFLFEVSIDHPLHKGILNSFNFTEVAEDLEFDDNESMKKEWDELEKFEEKFLATVKKESMYYESLEEFLQVHNSSGLDWKRIFDLAFNRTVESSWKIRTNIADFTDLNEFLNNSDMDLVLKYVKWRTVLSFYRRWTPKKNQTLENKCLSMTMNDFENAVIPWFIETTFDKQKRAEIVYLSRYLRNSFYSLINQTSWLDDKTKSEAKSKLRAMDLTVGYTDEMTKRSEIDEMYKNFNVSHNFWLDSMNLQKYRQQGKIDLLGSSAFRMGIPTHETDAEYSPYENRIEVTIAILQSPFYHSKLPNSLKFGGVGTVIGHEMAHAFDSNCYKFDYDGRSRNWWTLDSLRNFKERYRCLESQYNKFVYSGIRVNGTHTSGENIADNVGMRIALDAYLSSLNADGGANKFNDKLLPGVEFNNMQLFFLKFAQNFCDGTSVEERLKLMKNDEHTLNQFRAIGVLMNVPEFSEVFKCKFGSYMNPFKKCTVYGN